MYRPQVTAAQTLLYLDPSPNFYPYSCFTKTVVCLWFVCLCQQRVWLWGSDSEPLERLRLLHLKAPGKTSIEAKPIKKPISLFISISPQLYRPSVL